MTDEIAPAVADTAAPTTSAPAVTTPPVEQRPQISTDTPAFSVPDAYKDKPWAAKIKSQDDVYKQIDNLQGLVGKKSVVPDFEQSTPEQIEEYFSALRPADKSAYKFGDGADETFTGTVADLFSANGISAYQGNKIIEGYQAFERAQLEEARSADGFKAEMTKSFGDKYDGNVTAVVKEHKTHLSTEDQALMDSLPNSYLGLVYRLTENMRKAYGAQETGAAVDKGGVVQGADLEGQRRDLRSKLSTLESKPHTAAEKQALIDQLTNTYKGK